MFLHYIRIAPGLALRISMAGGLVAFMFSPNEHPLCRGFNLPRKIEKALCTDCAASVS
jgi:hypothetical protein